MLDIATVGVDGGVERHIAKSGFRCGACWVRGSGGRARVRSRLLDPGSRKGTPTVGAGAGAGTGERMGRRLWDGEEECGRWANVLTWDPSTGTPGLLSARPRYGSSDSGQKSRRLSHASLAASTGAVEATRVGAVSRGRPRSVLKY